MSLNPGKIVAIGLNYVDHIRETGMEPPAVPLVLSKYPTSVIGSGEAIVLPRGASDQVDWETELAVLIGRPMRHVSVDRALEHVAGYTVGNDVTARDVQAADGQWVRAKSFDTFCPLLTDVVPLDQVPDPQALAIRTRVNGDLVQDSTTAEMIFSVAEILAFCSGSFTLVPGDIVLTGTPWGCGAWSDPPRFLRQGDVVECEIESVGRLTNPVVSA